MADNTRVKKLARKLQAETGLRYTEALARVRLQGAAALEKNMPQKTIDTMPLGTYVLAPEETREFHVASERSGYIRRLHIEAPNLAALIAESFTVSGLPQTTGGPCPASMLVGDVGPLFLDPSQQVRLTLTNRSAEQQTVGVHLDFDDRTEATYDRYHDVFRAAQAAGMVRKNQFNGLGVVILKPGETGVLQDTLNRNVRIKRCVLDVAPGADEVPPGWAETQVLVNRITVAMLPIDMGSDMPLCAVNDSQILSRTLVLLGQTVSIHLTNPTEHLMIVSGGLKVDELNPYWAQQQYENAILQAATRALEAPVNQQVGQTEPWRAAQAGHVEVEVRPVAGHHLERLELTVVGSTAPFKLLLNGVDLPCDWSESDEVGGSWDTIVHFKDGRVFGSDPDRTAALGTEWRTSGPPVPVFGEALSVVVVQGEGVAAAKVFTTWRRVATEAPVG